MNRTLLVLTLILFFGCTRKSENGPSDSLLSHPRVTKDTSRHVSIDSSGLVIDSSAMRTPEHKRLLARFTPIEVVTIYGQYRPLRKDGTSQAEINAFLKAHSITQEELLAILEEGDMLGWKKQP